MLISLRRTRYSLLAAASVGVMLAGCGGSNRDGHTRAGSGLAAAMASVPGRGPATRYLEYVNMARLRADGIVSGAAGDAAGQRIKIGWALVAGLGIGLRLANEAPLLPRAIGLDPFSVDAAMTLGSQTKPSAYAFTGHFDADEITAKFSELGAQPHNFGSMRGLSAPPHVVARKLARQEVFVDDALENVVVTKTQFVAAVDAASLPIPPHPGATLRDTGRYDEIADCLGDVVGAIVSAPPDDTNSMVVAVGVRDPGTRSEPLREVLCSAPAPGKEPQVRNAFARAFAPGATDPISGGPVSASVSSVEVSDVGGIARAVLTTREQYAGYLIAGLADGEAPYWDGSCPAARAAQGRC